MIEIIIGIVVIIAIILIIFINYYNKFQFAIIKINEAEKNIDLIIERKKENLERIKPIIANELKIENFLKGIEGINLNKTNHFERDKKINDAYRETLTIVDENEKLNNNETISNVLEILNDCEIDEIASIKFYNDSVTNFNKLIVSFPSNILRLFFRYKKKELYTQEKKEIYDILNEQKTTK